MKVTENAIKVINEALQKTGKAYCHVGLFNRCHGNKALDLRLVDKEDASHLTEIDGITLDIDEEALEFLKDFTMDGKDSGILFIPPEGWAPAYSENDEGCCGGHHHEDGECCGNHEHHEGGCCGNHKHHHHEEGECCCGGQSDGDCCCKNK